MSAPVVFEVEVDSDVVAVGVDTPQVSVDSTAYPIVQIGAVPGRQGEPGPPGEGFPVVGEVPLGVKDDVNVTFTTSQPYRSDTTAVCRNGLREVRGAGYTESGGDTIIFTTAPASSDDLSIDYIIQ